MDVPTSRHILVIDDNDEHIRIVQTVMGQEPHHSLQVISAVEEALNCLNRRGRYAQSPRPQLILLDLNLLAGEGWTILRHIKADPELRRIPTVVLTPSAAEADIFRSYQNQGNCYVVKSANLDQLAIAVEKIQDFWLGIVTLPLE